MAVSGYSIWHINAEFPQYAHFKDLGQLGAYIIGRPWGQAIYISEFYGRSNILVYYPNYPSYPTYSTVDLAFSTVHGTFNYSCASHESGGNNSQYLYIGNNTGNTYLKLIDIHIPWMGYTWSREYLASVGNAVAWNGGNFGGGAMTFRFYG